MLFQVCIEGALNREWSKQECLFKRNCPPKEDGGLLEGNGRKEGRRWRARRDPGRTPSKREDRQSPFSVTMLSKVTGCCLGFVELGSPASPERCCSIWFLCCLQVCAISEIHILTLSRFSRMYMYIYNTVEDMAGSLWSSPVFQFQLMSGQFRIFINIHVSVV